MRHLHYDSVQPNGDIAPPSCGLREAFRLPPRSLTMLAESRDEAEPHTLFLGREERLEQMRLNGS